MPGSNPYSPPSSPVGPVSRSGRLHIAFLSSLVGAISPGIWLSLRNATAAHPMLDIDSLAAWCSRDLLLSLLLALPALAFARHCGLRRPLALWAVAAAAGTPMGFVLANPVTFAWSPTEADFLLGPRWGDMATYMVLFGLAGLVYGTLHSLCRHRDLKVEK